MSLLWVWAGGARGRGLCHLCQLPAGTRTSLVISSFPCSFEQIWIPESFLVGSAGRQPLGIPSIAQLHLDERSTCLSSDAPGVLSAHPPVGDRDPLKSTLPGGNSILTWVALETGSSLPSKEASSLGRAVVGVGVGKEMTSGCNIYPG